MSIEDEEHEQRAQEFISKYEKLLIGIAAKPISEASKDIFDARRALIKDLQVLLAEENRRGSATQQKRLQAMLADIMKQY